MIIIFCIILLSIFHINAQETPMPLAKLSETTNWDDFSREFRSLSAEEHAQNNAFISFMGHGGLEKKDNSALTLNFIHRHWNIYREVTECKNSALTYCLQNNLLDNARNLLEHYSIDINIANSYGNTALHIAIQKGQKEFIKKLCEKKAIHTVNNEVNSPLHLALNLHDSLKQEIIDILCEHKKDDILVNECNKGGFLPLTKAIGIKDDHVRNHVVQKLLSNTKININAHNNNRLSYTPLHDAVHLLNPFIVKLLLDNGADINVTACPPDNITIFQLLNDIQPKTGTPQQKAWEEIKKLLDEHKALKEEQLQKEEEEQKRQSIILRNKKNKMIAAGLCLSGTAIFLFLFWYFYN